MMGAPRGVGAFGASRGFGALGGSGVQAGPDLVRQRESVAAALDFAVAQILRDDTALGTLPGVLARLVSLPGVRAALAFQPSASQAARVLAMHPPDAVDAALIVKLGAVTLTQRHAAAGGPPVQVQLAPDLGSALLAYSALVDGQCLCALALIGDAASWDAETRAAAHAVAAIVATQIRHANDLARLAERQAELADQTERLNCMIASAIPGVLITDERGVVTHVSRSFGVLFGIEEPASLAGTSAASVMRRIGGVFGDPERFARRATEVHQDRRPVTGEQLLSADGRTLEADYWPVLVDGRYRGDIWLAWDMSDRTRRDEQRRQMLEAEHAARRLAERTQRQLAEQNERLRRLDEDRNQFLAIVSHELRTPLTSIISFTELIRGEAGELTPEGIMFLDIIERNADRLHRLIGDLLMLERLEAGALPLDLAEVSVPELAAEAVRSASAGAAKQGITLEVSTEAGPAMHGDARRLLQVLDNLIANAVKFTHRSGHVQVIATCQDRTWRIDVTDSGIGIPPDEVGRLFSRFVRASNARTEGLPGTGLGLSVVKVLVEMHGGRVEVSSVLDQGSTFSVYLPTAGGSWGVVPPGETAGGPWGVVPPGEGAS
jgi:signal transduction histidine kinase